MKRATGVASGDESLGGGLHLLSTGKLRLSSGLEHTSDSPGGLLNTN